MGPEEGVGVLGGTDLGNLPGLGQHLSRKPKGVGRVGGWGILVVFRTTIPTAPLLGIPVPTPLGFHELGAHSAPYERQTLS